MSDLTAPGLATVEEIGPLGMIALRGDLASPQMAAAVYAAVGLPVPARRRIETEGERSAGWMSPDELLLVLPHEGVAGALAAVQAALAGQHHLAADVSDMRAVFRIRGPEAREVLAKIAPADLAPPAFGPGELRRTRAAQVACAFWMSGADEFTLIAFRSVGRYVADLLEVSARPGGEVGVFA